MEPKLVMVEVETNNGSNPYVGPRTYRPDEANKFFGRRREQRELEALIVSRRSVLFYAASGAGKSSLLFTKVLPDLVKDGFEILPVGSVSGHDGGETKADNIFVYNLLSSLQQAGDEPPDMATLTLAEFLDRLVYKDGLFVYDEGYIFSSDEELKPRVLVIDQFEEILTTNSAFWKQREEFFRQLGEALEADEQLWLVLTIREDFVAGLDPYVHNLPERLRYRYYMQQLDRRAARQAITRPVEKIRPFDDEAADLLVDNLLAMRKNGDEDVLGQASQFVEPVQLQAVCYQMWQKMRKHPGKAITVQDVKEYADVDKALIAFYEDTIAGTVADTGVAEIDLRSWFESELITEAGTRNMVYRGDEWTGSLPTPIAEEVLKRFILREVVRPGGVWYELVHDRFVAPILESNREWRLDQPLLRLAQQWDDGGRREGDLLGGRQLERFLDSNWQALGPLVAEFVETSKLVRSRELEDERSRELEEQRVRAEEAVAAERSQRLRTRIAIIGFVAAVTLATIAGFSRQAAQQSAEEALSARATADAAAAAGKIEAQRAIEARETALAERGIAQVNATRAFQAQIVALGAQATVRANAEATGTSQAVAYQQLQIDLTRLSEEISQDVVPTIVTMTPVPTVVVPTRVVLASSSSETALSKLDVPYRSQWDADAAAASADMGSTSLAMLLNFYGVDKSPDQIREENFPYKGDLDFENFSELISAAKGYGLTMSYQQFDDKESSLLNLHEFIDEGRPPITLVNYHFWKDITGNLYDFGHFVVVVGYDEEHIYIHDPLFGLWQPRAQGAFYVFNVEDFLVGWGGFSPGENPNWTAIVAPCTNEYSFVKDVTIPDGTVVKPGETFQKIWRYRNTGTCTWDKDYKLIYLRGSMGARDETALPRIVRNGDTVDLTLTLTAPTTPGTYRSTWELVAPDGTEITRPYVDIVVKD